MKEFDLTNILHVYEFMTFLLRLREREKEVMEVVKGGESELKDPENFIKSLHQDGHPKRKHTEWAISSTEQDRSMPT